MADKNETVSSKIPRTLREDMNKIMQSEKIISESEFIRQVLKERIQRGINKDEYNALSTSLAALEDTVNDIIKRMDKLEKGI